MLNKKLNNGIINKFHKSYLKKYLNTKHKINIPVVTAKIFLNNVFILKKLLSKYLFI